MLVVVLVVVVVGNEWNTRDGCRALILLLVLGGLVGDVVVVVVGLLSRQWLPVEVPVPAHDWFFATVVVAQRRYESIQSVTTTTTTTHHPIAAWTWHYCSFSFPLVVVMIPSIHRPILLLLLRVGGGGVAFLVVNHSVAGLSIVLHPPVAMNYL